MKREFLLIFFTVILLTSFLPSISVENSVKSASNTVTASFSFTPVVPYSTVTVNFDASKSISIAGWIVSYTWGFGDGTSPLTETDPTTTHTYLTPGNYTVTLTVTDNELQTNTTSKIITVLPYPLGSWIDIYTQKGGEEYNEPDGNFAPGENVKLFARVTYDSEPVANKMVGFEVEDALFNTRLTRTVETDNFGVAELNFTIPSTGSPKEVIGDWVAFAISSISEQTISDTVKFRVTGIMIDVYTQKPEPYGGKGPNMLSDAYGPQEEVVLFALVTYDFEPVANKMVAFEVTDPLGNVFYRTNNTDMDGIATVKFRIPWPGMDAPSLFGTWYVRGWVEVLGLVVEDTLTFRFGWIVEIKESTIVDIDGQNKTSFLKGEHAFFNLTVINIAFVSKIAIFTVVAYDAEGVPIGYTALYNVSVLPGTYWIFIASIQIPEWAFSGVSIIYANAYNSLPQDGGVPYCPERSAHFTIN